MIEAEIWAEQPTGPPIRHTRWHIVVRKDGMILTGAVCWDGIWNALTLLWVLAG